MDEQTIIQARKKHKNTYLSTKALLLTLSPENLGETYIIDKDVMTIGRDSSCDIVVNDQEVSGSHCRISVPEEKTFILEDLDSTNGTFLNKKAIKKPAQIFYSDRIVLGKTVLRFFLEESIAE